MAGENGKNMSLEEFIEVLAEIMAKHSWFNGIQGHAIKYVRPHFDTRTGDFYGVTFEGIRGIKDLFVVNENRHRNLTEWIREFLALPPDKAGWVDWQEYNKNKQA